jgi:hypothetical protein
MERTLPTAEQLTETITGAIAIAPQLIDDAAWLWTDAYWPPGRNPDRPTRLGPRRDPGADPDHVHGERLALGLGNDAARAAYTRSGALVVDAHRLAGRALAHYSGRTFTSGYRRPPRGHDYRVIVDSTVRRLRTLTELDVAHGPDEARRLAHGAAVALVEAHAALRAVLRDVDGTGQLPPERRCADCGKACEDQKRKRCWQCVQRRARGKKPVRRWAEAHAAKERRVERGEDHGDSPAPKGRYIDGVWTPTTPLPPPTSNSHLEAS